MQIPRRYTAEGKDPFAAFTFVPRTSRIANPDGSVVFEMKDVLAPEPWSQVAVDILAQKYFRKAGVPAQTERVPEEGVPEWLQRSVPAAEATRAPARRRTPARCSAGWRAAGPTGAGRAATSPPRPTPAPSTTRPATCWRRRWRRPTRRSGSTPACTGPTASRGRPQGHYRVDPATGEVKRSDVGL